MCFLLYTSFVLEAPYTFNDILITYKKKELSYGKMSIFLSIVFLPIYQWIMKARNIDPEPLSCEIH
jgi:hypothetical protein